MSLKEPRCWVWETLEELVEDILDRRVFTDEETGCWLWRPGQWDSGNGYGKVSFKGKGIMVHRAVWTVLVGPIPEGHVLDHEKCWRRACCNPDHLVPVLPVDNTHAGLAVLYSRTL